MFRILTVFFMWVLASLPLRAEVSQDVQDLADALALPEIIDVMRTEGIKYGNDLADEMFPARAGDTWNDLVVAIYDHQRMDDVIMNGFADAYGDGDTSSAIKFFESDLGRRIVRLEISARRALMDEAIEDASQEHVDRMVADHDPRLELLEEFITVNSLLDSNVVGALNSNFAFFSGLNEGGAFPAPMSEQEMLADVWQQEEEIRSETKDWLYLFLAMAYQPLNDDELNAYIDLSRSPEGQLFNQALFVGFDLMFNEISHALGLAAAQMMQGMDL